MQWLPCPAITTATWLGVGAASPGDRRPQSDCAQRSGEQPARRDRATNKCPGPGGPLGARWSVKIRRPPACAAPGTLGVGRAPSTDHGRPTPPRTSAPASAAAQPTHDGGRGPWRQATASRVAASGDTVWSAAGRRCTARVGARRCGRRREEDVVARPRCRRLSRRRGRAWRRVDFVGGWASTVGTSR